LSTSLVRRITASNVSRATLEPEPVPTDTHYLKLLQVWQWGQQTPQSVALRCKRYGFTGVTVKALDGTAWMDNFDGSAAALGSYQEIDQQASYFHEQGLYYFVWTNPLQPNWQTQADMTAMIVEDTLADGLMLDIEPYAQFWGPWAQQGLGEQFMQRIRHGTTGWVALQPDPRVSALQSLRISEWVPYADAMMGQHYWSDFHTDPEAELFLALELGSVLGIVVLPTLPGNAPGTWPLNTIAKFPGFCVWRDGTTPEQTLAQLGALQVAGLQTNKFPTPGGFP